MMKGWVTPTLEPVITLVVRGKPPPRRIRAIIDTGFSGSLCLPRKLVQGLQLKFLGLTRFEMADGQEVEMEASLAKVEFQGAIREVTVVGSNSKDKLVGAALLKDQKLTIDYPARKVALE
jgi:clan AA aspartic protease